MTAPIFELAALDAVQWLRVLPAESVDLVVTDPAYESLEKHRAIGTTTRLTHSKSSSNDWFRVFPNARFGELFDEVFRVLKTGGRAVISDIVSDKEVPADLQRDSELWSGCISGAFQKDAFLKAFADAGFHSTRVLNLDPDPWRTVEGYEFRSMTVEACKGEASMTVAPCCSPVGGKCC